MCRASVLYGSSDVDAGVVPVRTFSASSLDHVQEASTTDRNETFSLL